eukprot:TRINITY_DN2665_c0_g1_i2.p1 TRINITY_DN2665_c0_g1~~TRINITY_DN2665_c0_g1_i2.p1  ORF type:complete len:623 (+),score=188.50 TRINITY_DN2665_c0_g1_i2:249-1871(+)
MAVHAAPATPYQRRRRPPLAAAVAATVTAVAAAAAVATLPATAAADSTASYTATAPDGSLWCTPVPILGAVGLGRTCPADPTTTTGSPFLVTNHVAYDTAMGLEDEDLYTLGGLHPVRIGDRLGNYTVVGKLGWGTFSTVWRAVADGSGEEVAVKLWRSGRSYFHMASEENKYLLALRAHDPAGDYPIMKLRDTFMVFGAHGAHAAAVFELMGVSLRVALHAYLNRPEAPRGRGAPLRVVARVAKQILEGLALAHYHRLLHTDLKLENVALRLPSPLDAAVLPPPDADAEADAFWAPAGKAHSPAGRVAIIDWGNTEEMGDDYVLPYAHQLQTESYRAPEAIVGTGASPGTDLWSVGCIVYDMAVGDYLFRPDEAAPWGLAVDHLALMQDVLGSPTSGFPPWFRTAGAHADEYFEAADAAAGPDAPLRLKGIGGHEYTPLPTLLGRTTDFKAEVRASLADFIGQMLRLDPNARPTAAALLRHEFLTRAWTAEELAVPTPEQGAPAPSAGGGGGEGEADAVPAPGGVAGAVAAGVAALTGL